MKFPWANSILLVLFTFQVITGFFGFKNGQESYRFLLWLHGLGGYAVVIILAWKGGVVLNAWRRGLEWSFSRLAFAILLSVLSVILFSGLLWTFDGPVYWLGFSLLTWHVVLAFVLAAGFIWHVLYMRFILRHPQAKDRRAFLRLGGIMAGAWLVRDAFGGFKSLGGLKGSSRRFTGSYEVKSFSRDYPANIWLADKVPVIDSEQWRLRILPIRQEVTGIDLVSFNRLPLIEFVATLDCTGGWYSTQTWKGVQVGTMLESLGLSVEGKSITFQSATGYQRRFPIDEAFSFLLASRVAGEPLTAVHGYPVRLVAPGRRGYDWVKWVSEIRINTSSAYWQLPLPLQ